MKRNDLLLISSLMLITIIIYILYNFNHSSSNSFAEITVDGRIFGTYSLAESQEISINDHNILKIEDGVARMLDADCPDKLCINQGEISLGNESIVCLPNKTIIEVKGGKNSEIDADTN